MTPTEQNRFVSLYRLEGGDRLIYQPCDPEAVWWERRPQLGQPRPSRRTFKMMLRRGWIVEALAPKGSLYSGAPHLWRSYAVTPAGIAEFMRLGDLANVREKEGAAA